MTSFDIHKSNKMGLTLSNLKDDEQAFGYLESPSPIRAYAVDGTDALEKAQVLMERFRTILSLNQSRSNDTKKKRNSNSSSKKLKSEELGSLIDVNACNRQLSSIDQDILTTKVFSAATRLIL